MMPDGRLARTCNAYRDDVYGDVFVRDIEMALFDLAHERIKSGKPLDAEYINDPRRLALIKAKEAVSFEDTAS